MFERFTKDARGVVTGAVTRAERAGADSVSVEYLLLALLDRQGTRASFALAALGVVDRRAELEAALAAARRRGGLSTADAEALAGIGIDVTEIVARVEEAHGPGALEGDRKDKSWWAGRRSFARESKDVLEKSLRIAVGRGDRHIGDEHLLLAMAATPGVVADVLAQCGAGYGAVERALYGE
ncbi:Clp protease N-terminal domain-containing protein [Streptomyces sp. NPDC048696]|uniref:Clp protease N-terminal domain-containing protein n=1 Tax=Streptomyces sp. NPDC048696 TaxID=3365585 RepID=UPI0037105D5D